jgi:uncharacterized protein (TIGR00156 family)
MKGVIVQVGEPKSIVLFNNGKIRAIPTPAGCRVGMVVSVKLNNKLKIIAFTLSAVLLVALGIFIGKTLNGDNPAVPPATRGDEYGTRTEHEREYGGQIQTVTVNEAKNLPDDTKVLLTGKLAQSPEDEKYIFSDSTGEISVEIDRKIMRRLSVGISDTVEISGEVDNEKGKVEIDVKNIRKP